MLSVNRNALAVLRRLIERQVEFNVNVKSLASGTTFIDAGINSKGGFLAGKLITEICLGGYGKANLSSITYGDMKLPSIFVATDYPAIATLGSQFAGWKISVGKYFAMGSGPARALALKPKELFEKIGYRDESDVAVILLETTEEPPPEAAEFIAKECNVAADKLYIIATPTSSIAGSVQISGRVVETGLHKLTEVGLDPKCVLYGCGSAPIAPVHPKFAKAMGRTNDMILYGGSTMYIVDYESDEELREITEKVPSSTSKDYGKPFAEVFKEAGYDFYKIDPGLFAPASITVNNIRTGTVFKAGEVNVAIIKKSIGLA
ncbi:methenyltetrahydromethanopterin cyclohydrolase [Candidatus Bathyarchaeota archaeon]|nr:methenyltetrahydromethanopterin cyclohydrolase [Candidatus Bathyarchaeota archaeon]